MVTLTVGLTLWTRFLSFPVLSSHNQYQTVDDNQGPPVNRCTSRVYIKVTRLSELMFASFWYVVWHNGTVSGRRSPLEPWTCVRHMNTCGLPSLGQTVRFGASSLQRRLHILLYCEMLEHTTCLTWVSGDMKRWLQLSNTLVLLG